VLKDHNVDLQAVTEYDVERLYGAASAAGMAGRGQRPNRNS
jgi:hypothetical protein